MRIERKIFVKIGLICHRRSSRWNIPRKEPRPNIARSNSLRRGRRQNSLGSRKRESECWGTTLPRRSDPPPRRPPNCPLDVLVLSIALPGQEMRVFLPSEVPRPTRFFREPRFVVKKQHGCFEAAWMFLKQHGCFERVVLWPRRARIFILTPRRHAPARQLREVQISDPNSYENRSYRSSPDVTFLRAKERFFSSTLFRNRGERIRNEPRRWC